MKKHLNFCLFSFVVILATLLGEGCETKQPEKSDPVEANIKMYTHGKNYLVANESYRISDISLMLNKQVPQSAARVVYSNALAKKDLGIHFIPAQETLNNCG